MFLIKVDERFYDLGNFMEVSVVGLLQCSVNFAILVGNIGFARSLFFSSLSNGCSVLGSFK